MAFIIEDGTGKLNSNTYVLTTEADAYFLDRANTDWVGRLMDKEAALIKATAYLDMAYGLHFPGKPLVWNQALAWPRSFAWDIYSNPLIGIPAFLKKACFEAAALALTKPLLSPTDPIALVKTRSEGSISTEYNGGSVIATYQIVHELMRPLLMHGARVRRC